MNYLATDASNNYLLVDLSSAFAFFCVSLDTFELFCVYLRIVGFCCYFYYIYCSLYVRRHGLMFNKVAAGVVVMLNIYDSLSLHNTFF